MISLGSLLVTGHLLTSPLYPADFQVAPSPQKLPPPIAVSPGVESAEQPETFTLPRYNIAHGFGNGIPLAFAAKQIVPPSFRVVYRNSVDQNAPVSWSGNRPWNQALWLALRQHGLHMVLVGHTVTIGY